MNSQLKDHSSLSYQYGSTDPPVIHRTSNCIILGQQSNQSKEQKRRDLSNKGWMAAQDKPYIALGEFQNVISAVEGLKGSIPHSKEMTADTKKMISRVKRQQNPMFKEGRADRTLKILSKQPQRDSNQVTERQLDLAANRIDLRGVGDVDSTSIMKKMKGIEEQFYNTFSNYNDNHGKSQGSKHKSLQQQKGQGDNEAQESYQGTNQRLITPAMKKLMNSKDASSLLKDEIQESQLRLKAAKYGHKLEEIVPQYHQSFYLPDKTLYFDKSQTNPNSSLNQKNKSNQNPNKSFNQSFQQNNTVYDDTAFITEPSLIEVRNSYNDVEQRQSQNVSFADYMRKRAGITQDSKYSSSRDQNQTKLHNRSFFSQRPHKTTYQNNRTYQTENTLGKTMDRKAFRTFDCGRRKFFPRKPQRLNELSIKYREEIQKIQDYNNEERSTRNRNDQKRGTAASQAMPYNSTNDNSIRFVSMIDSKPVNPPYLNLVPLNNFNAKDQELGKLMNKDQSGGLSSINKGNDEFGGQGNQMNWGKMLNEDLEEMLKNKVDLQYEELINRKKTQSQRKSFVDAGKPEQDRQTFSHATNDITTEKMLENLNQHRQPQLSKIQAMLLKKLISFESLDTNNTEDLKKKLYNFFFNWSRELNSDATTVNTKTYEEESDSKGGYAYSEDMEEKKKRIQHKLDQELIEKEENGGFAKVLRDIFNPQDSGSMELDSVYQLKMLCKAYYEKKEQLSTNLIQTLDALSNERPKTLSLKRNHLNLDQKNGKLHSDIEWMRINAERERIAKYRHIAKESAILYYKVLKRFTELTTQYEREKAQEKNSAQIDPQVKMKAIVKENILKDVLSYIAGKTQCVQIDLDFMRAVIENGNVYTKEHVFMMLRELDPEHLDQQLANYISIVLQEMQITTLEFDDFLREIRHMPQLQSAYHAIKTSLVNDYQ